MITETQSLAGGLIRQLVNERLSMIAHPPLLATLAPLPPNPEPPLHPPHAFWRLFSRRSPGVLRHSLVLKESDFPFFLSAQLGSVAGILYECVNGKTFSSITLSGHVHSLSCKPHYRGRKKKTSFEFLSEQSWTEMTVMFIISCFSCTQCLHHSSFSSVLEWDIRPIETWQSLSWCDSGLVLDSRQENIFFTKMSETISILVTERRKTTRWNTSNEGSRSKDTCSQVSSSLSLCGAVILWGRSRFGVNVPRFSISVPDTGSVLTFPSKPQVFNSSLHDRKSQKALHRLHL